MKNTFTLALAILSIITSRVFAETGVVVSLHPLSSVILAPFGAYYGKVSLEYDALGVRSLTTAISGYHGKRNLIEKFEYMYDSSNDTINFTKNQLSVFVGKRFYIHPVYLQPTVNIGYYEFRDKAHPENSINNMFLGSLIYVGTKFTHGKIEWGFDMGAGARLLGENRFDFLDKIILDANATIGYRF